MGTNFSMPFHILPIPAEEQHGMTWSWVRPFYDILHSKYLQSEEWAGARDAYLSCAGIAVQTLGIKFDPYSYRFAYDMLAKYGFIPGGYWGQPKPRVPLPAQYSSYLLEKCGDVCSYCNRPHKNYALDHVVPLSRGGSNGLWNLTLACQSCNSSKGSKLIWEWYQG